jgi:hypothetical protein
MGEQRDPGVGVKALQQREEIALLSRVDRGFVDPADQLCQERRLEFVHGGP